MSKYLLLTLSILMMPLAVRACDNDGPAQKSEQKAQQKELSERLAHSEYVVEKGKLARRPQGRQGTSTSLSHDDEFRVMEKGLDAAKSKLSIADGSAVIIAESGENYEVVIGNPPPAGTLGPDYTAKVLVDKKTLAVVEVKEMEVRDESAQRVEQFRELSERLAHSEYVVEKGKLARRPQGRQGTSTSLSHDDEFRVMEKGLDAAKSKLSIADGSAVIIAESGENYEVVIGNPPPAGTLGPDYTAKVLVDKKTLAISQILSGS